MEAEDRKTEFTVRELRVGDRPYVFNSALQTIRHSPSVASMPDRQFYAIYHEVVERLMDDPKVSKLVLCDPEDEWFIMAYAVLGQVEGIPVLHYIHVRGTERKNGIFQWLMDQLELTEESVFAYTFDTPDAVRMKRKKYRNAVFRPELALGGSKQEK